MSIGIFEAPSDPRAADRVGRILYILGVGSVALAVTLPLLDGGHGWEAMGVALSVVLLAGVVLTVSFPVSPLGSQPRTGVFLFRT